MIKRLDYPLPENVILIEFLSLNIWQRLLLNGFKDGWSCLWLIIYKSIQWIAVKVTKYKLSWFDILYFLLIEIALGLISARRSEVDLPSLK